MERVILLLLSLSLSLPPSAATTIAFDGKILASDSQVTYGSRKWLGRNKIIDFGDCYAGACGASETINWFTDRWKALGRDKALASVQERAFSTDDLAQFLVVNKKTVEITIIEIEGKEATVHHDHQFVPIALGSGQDFALGAMVAGSNAITAIEIAKQLDIHTGGIVHSVVIQP